MSNNFLSLICSVNTWGNQQTFLVPTSLSWDSHPSLPMGYRTPFQLTLRHPDPATALSLSLPPVWALQPYSVGTLAGPISFCSQLDSLKAPWTQFITCHAGSCRWTLLPVPGSDSICSPCRTVPCQCKHSLSRVTLDTWFVSLVEQSCSCHSLIYGSSYYGEFLPG